MLHSLGNLALLSNSANGGLQDLGWEKKKQTFRKYPFKMLLELEQFVEPAQVWDAPAIEKRRKAIVDFALARWD